MKRMILFAAATLLLLAPSTAAQTTDATHEASEMAGCGRIFPEQAESRLLDRSAEPYSAIEPAMLMDCRIGGRGVDTCEIRCNEMLGFYYSYCSVECDDEYDACCNCDDGATCHCYLDHTELWPVSPRR